jgi:cell shape-determining protein MreD
VGLVLRILATLWAPSALVFHPLLAVAVVASLSGRTGFALGAGLLSGFLADLVAARWIGENAFVHMLGAYGLAQLARRIDLSEPAPALAALLAATPFAWLAKLALAALFGVPQGEPPGALAWIAAAIVNAVYGGLLYRILRRREAL